MAQILTFTEYLSYVFTTDKSQSNKYDMIYTDVEETYVRNLLKVPTYDKVKAGAYTVTNRASFFAVLKKCIAKKIEKTYVEIGGAENTALGLVQRTNQYSEQADRAAVERKIKSISEVLTQYENQLIDLLEVPAQFPEYVAKNQVLSSDCPYNFFSINKNL
jgi:hypothetical protein